jgi:23S rRNA (uracil1939-C5)-methyltransferase
MLYSIPMKRRHKTLNNQSTFEDAIELATLSLLGMGPLGECFAKYEGELVTVFGGIPGEEVVAQIATKHRKNVAQVVKVLKPSPYRVAAPCAYFGQCTGCQWQHISYEHQLELKRQHIQETLTQISGLVNTEVSPTVPASDPYRYRNHARFTVRGGNLGFVNRFTHRFVRIDHCLLMHPWINGALNELQERSGETTQLAIRFGENTGSWLIQPTLSRADISLTTGQSHYEEALFGRKFRIASPSFFQVNTRQTERLMQLILDRLNLTGRETVVDAYAGVGTIAVLLAPYASRILAIEESSAAVKDAKENAYGLSNLEFLQEKTEIALEQFVDTPDALVLDPPRSGCHYDVLVAVKRLQPKRVVYVSCNPESLSRDLRELCPEPYHVDDVQPIDMFPQTHHVECVVTLSLAH